MELNPKKIIYNFWFFPFNLPLKEITDQEKKWSYQFSKTRKYEYQYSRGYTRYALSTILNIEPLLIPLIAAPGKPPYLEKGNGYISISHCRDALFVAWSNKKIGIDIESNIREIDYKKIAHHFFSVEENEFIFSEINKRNKEKFLSIWVMKEALIKYSRGNIFRDLKNWEIDFKNSRAVKRNENLEIYSKSFKYKSWIIGLATKEKLESRPIINNMY